MLKKLLVIGRNGQLGRSIAKLAKEYPQYHFTFVGRAQLDLADSQQIEAFFADKQFDVIINCAAYTAVDQAESDVTLADQINHLAVAQLAHIAKAQEMTLLHISTDYVFDGKGFRPYVESDAVNPQSVYGQSKLQGELAIQAIAPQGAIIRTSWVYSEFGHNFVKTMLRLGQERDQLNVIFDQIGTPTYASDLADAILHLIGQDTLAKQQGEIYHFSNEGVCSWYDFAQAIFEMNEVACVVSPIESKDYPTPAQRPHYSLMNKAKIKQTFSITIPYWRDSLKTCLDALKK